MIILQDTCQFPAQEFSPKIIYSIISHGINRIS